MSTADPVDTPLNPPESPAQTDGEEPSEPALAQPASTSTAGGGKKKVFVKSSSVQIQEPPVSERRGYSIVKIEDKHGPLHSAIPVMPLPLAVICCLLNCFLPGIGTFMSAFSVFCCGPTRIAKPLHAFGLNLASAFLQMLTFIVIVGWIWSILWGMTFVQLCLDAKAAQQRRRDSEAVRMHYCRQESTATRLSQQI